ncbi:hypothetical protein BJ508DRAFT_326222 [Ascobolus immersus RN42]|uniref:Protein kinase domain-containing protein n=1 Tax=Ascobolus immersus RN42 TaxID=1160509 RepID=A0A3N4I620_ASCIM|nr:hypothetical protein BJ508DRAFT_326222 [Ascobolus immersus RN42]
MNYFSSIFSELASSRRNQSSDRGLSEAPATTSSSCTADKRAVLPPSARPVFHLSPTLPWYSKVREIYKESCFIWQFDDYGPPIRLAYPATVLKHSIFTKANLTILFDGSKRINQHPSCKAHSTYLDCIQESATHVLLILCGLNFGTMGHQILIFNFIDAGLVDKKLPFTVEDLQRVGLTFYASQVFIAEQSMLNPKYLSEGAFITVADQEYIPVVGARDASYGVPFKSGFRDSSGESLRRFGIKLRQPPSEAFRHQLKELSTILRDHRHLASIHSTFCQLGDITIIFNSAEAICNLSYILRDGKNVAFPAWNPLGLARRTAITTKWFQCLANTVFDMHGHGFYHPCFTPRSVLITRSFDVLVIGFGLTTERAEVGRYTPPEQYIAGPTSSTSPQADIYSLGLIFMEILALRWYGVHFRRKWEKWVKNKQRLQNPHWKRSRSAYFYGKNPEWLVEYIDECFIQNTQAPPETGNKTPDTLDIIAGLVKRMVTVELGDRPEAGEVKVEMDRIQGSI